MVFEGTVSVLHGHVQNCSICKKEDTEFLLAKDEKLVCYECKDKLDQWEVLVRK